MEGKLLKILQDYLYKIAGEKSDPENIDIIIYVNEFWYQKINEEAVSHIGHNLIEVGHTIKCIYFRIMNHKITFVCSNGNTSNHETNDFFKAIYAQLP